MPLISRIKALNPINLLDPLMNLVIKSALKKALSSLVKGLSAALIASLTVAAASPVDSHDKLVLAAMAGFTALLHAIISGLKRAQEYDFAKIVP